MVPVKKRFNPAGPSHLEQKSSEIPRRLTVVTKIGANELRHLQGKAIPHQVTIHNETFTEEVNLSQCRFERELDLAGCRFEKGLILSDTRVHGPLILDRVEIGCRSEKHIELLRQDRQRMLC